MAAVRGFLRASEEAVAVHATLEVHTLRAGPTEVVVVVGCHAGPGKCSIARVGVALAVLMGRDDIPVLRNEVQGEVVGNLMRM